MSNDMLRRNKALAKTRARFDRRAFAWGSADCVTMVRFHLVAMGHKPPKMPLYKTAVGAKRALGKVGFETLEDLFDSMLERIPPAFARPGDIILIEGEAPFDCAGVWTGRKMLSWFQGAEKLTTATLLEFKGAWRA